MINWCLFLLKTSLKLSPPSFVSILVHHFCFKFDFLHTLITEILSRVSLIKKENLPQLSSSLPSGHSGCPEQCKCPAMQERSLHWNWSALQVIFWQLSGDSSEPSGQSFVPSQSHPLCIQVKWSPHSYSSDKQNELLLATFGHPCTQPKLGSSKMGHFKTYLFVFPIRTVILPIALPFARYAKVFSALELGIGGTSDRRTILLIRVISTVVI